MKIGPPVLEKIFAHRGNHKLKNFSGENPRTPLTRGGVPPLVPSPTRDFGTRSDFRRTTFKYVATGLGSDTYPYQDPLYRSESCRRRLRASVYARVCIFALMYFFSDSHPSESEKRFELVWFGCFHVPVVPGLKKSGSSSHLFTCTCAFTVSR